MSPIRSRRARIVAIVIALVAVPTLVAGGWFWWQLDPLGDPGDDVTVSVEPGWGNHEIGDALADAGVIGSSFAFRSYVQVTSAGPFQAGEYDLRERLGIRTAVSELETGPRFVYEELALPPGLTIAEIAARVGELSGRDAQRFRTLVDSGVVRSRFQPEGVTSLEGLTWPDTYFVSEDQTDEQVLRLLVEAFDEHASAVGLAKEAPAGGLTLYEAVAVASLIQTEAGVAEDRQLISAVIRNRLADGMPLQIDASVIYARGGGDTPITLDELELASPYNTYTVTGLPPTPIATVTEEALKAAMAPADVPYRYYVLIDPRGKHAFATTFAEHEQNVARARELGLLA